MDVFAMIFWCVGFVIFFGALDILKYWRKPMPWYCRLPFVHYFPFIFWAHCNGNHRQFQYDMFNHVGSNKCAWWMMPYLRGYATVDPEVCEHILKTNFENFQIRPLRALFFEDMLGTGIFNSDGEIWKVQRKTASYEFSQNRFRTFMVDVFIEHSAKMLKVLEVGGLKKPIFDLQALFSRYTLDSICEIAFGFHAGSLDDVQMIETVPFARAFDFVTRRVARRTVEPWWFVVKWLNVGQEKEYQQQLRIVEGAIRDIIHQREKFTTDQLASETNLLSRFMSLPWDSMKADMENMPREKFLRDIVMSFLLAGRDTTSNCLSWLFYELTRHAEVERRLLAEIEEHLGSETEAVNFDSLRGMHYLQSVLSEALRLHPSVPDDPKVAVKADVLPGGHHVKPGDIVNFMPWVMGRRPELWGEDCLEFKPERWLNASGEYEKQSPYKFTAFQAGPRLCLGVDMAQLEIKVAIVTILPKFKFTLHPQHTKVRPDHDLTLPIKGGLYVIVSSRDAQKNPNNH